MNHKLAIKRHIYTVSELTQDIKTILQNTFACVWVEGEISNFKAHPVSGHFYFSLKDETAILQAVVFGGANNKQIKFKLENGLKVICFGKVSVYEKEGRYQLYVQNIEPKGIGSLQLALEQLKKKLEKEGLFAQEHKRTMPFLPSRIGVVTSLQGAAIKDILKVLHRRFSDIHIIISPCQVQGETAKYEIVKAIEDLNSWNKSQPFNEQIEVMIVGRGGGSMEDLWAFNEEIVAWAIYNSKIPIISAVGHERDTTIADLVADLRAPTPSVAAELVIPKKEDLREKLRNLTVDLKRTFNDGVLTLEEALDNLTHRLRLLNPATRIRQYQTEMENLAKQIYVRIEQFIKLRRTEFLVEVEKLSSLSPLNILSRGYSITFKMPEGTVIKDAGSLKIKDIVKTKLHKGKILSQVIEAGGNDG
jgi:exodeoxyribonuclease VII large subunit